MIPTAHCSRRWTPRSALHAAHDVRRRLVELVASEEPLEKEDYRDARREPDTATAGLALAYFAVKK